MTSHPLSQTRANCNISLTLAVNDEFRIDGTPSKVLNINNEGTKKRLRNWDAEKAKALRRETQTARYERALTKLNTDSKYAALHFTIARLFASQLRIDGTLLQAGGKQRRLISLAAKWAPSMGEFHDKHTFIVSSIAEILHPRESREGEYDRTLYLKQARMSYRVQTVSPLRKFLAVVERDISAGTFEDIKYDRVPSLAMDRYQGLFFKKDSDHFSEFLRKVATGSAKVSGAVLLPSTLVHKARGRGTHRVSKRGKKPGTNAPQLQQLAEQQLLDGQWKALVQRIKDSGTIESSITVCDVSGSMCGPLLPDGKFTPPTMISDTPNVSLYFHCYSVY
jgi:hypothetical protein